MSYGGIGNILSTVGGMALTPAMETYIQEMLRNNVLKSDMMKEFIKDPETLDTFGNVAGGTLGTLLSTGLNAGLGYATGGKEGAAAGAVQGLIMGGGAALQHEDFLKSMGMDGAKAAQSATPTKPASSPSIAEQVTGAKPAVSSSVSDLLGGATSTQAALPSSKIGENTIAAAAPKTETTKLDIATPANAKEEKSPGYFEMAGKLGLPAWALGAGLGSSMAVSNKRQQAEEERKREEAAKKAQMESLMASLFPTPTYAAGGMTVSSDNASVTFPDWFIKEFAGTGGLGAYATGGYVNPQQFDPDTAYPQAMIQKAQTYPGAAPIRNEVVNMERGGLLEGGGDGMSDDIPANIGGKEPVRVADGEYVVPASVAERFGEDRLHAMMNKVRAAAHAKKGKQIVENAGKRAFIQTMSGVKA